MTRRRRTLGLMAVVALVAGTVGCRWGKDDQGATVGGGDDSSGESVCPDDPPGISDDKILIGSTVPMSGPYAAYIGYPMGWTAWFSHLNETQGGFKLKDGRTLEIEWKLLDDAYEPPRALQNVRQLVERDEAFVVLDPVGTATNVAIRDYMNQAEVPQLFVQTGASMWGEEIDEYPWTIGLQPDYESTAVAYARYVLKENPDAKIGILYQNDDFGADFVRGIKEGLGDKVDQIVAEVSYEVSDASIDNQVSQIKNSGADVFMSFTTPTFAVQSIQRVAALDWDPLFVLASVSASVGSVMRPAGPKNSEGIVSSNYLKDPTDPDQADDPALVEYRKVLKKYSPKANPDDSYSVGGMMVGQTFQALIESIDGPVCRATLMEKAKNWSHDPKLTLDGITYETGPGDGFPMSKVRMQRFDGQIWKPFGEIIEGRPAGGDADTGSDAAASEGSDTSPAPGEPDGSETAGDSVPTGS